MSYKQVGTAGDLVRFGCSLKLECTACGAARTLNGVEVHNINGSRQFAELEKRLKCKRCGRKAARLVVLTPVWPDQAGR
jgi:rubredoxin